MLDSVPDSRISLVCPCIVRGYMRPRRAVPPGCSPLAPPTGRNRRRGHGLIPRKTPVCARVMGAGRRRCTRRWRHRTRRVDRKNSARYFPFLPISKAKKIKGTVIFSPRTGVDDFSDSRRRKPRSPLGRNDNMFGISPTIPLLTTAPWYRPCVGAPADARTAGP